MSLPPVLLLAPAATVSWFLLYIWIPHLRRVLIDQPNSRSSHRIPTPRGGGVAFIFVTVVATLIVLAVHRLSPREWSSAWLPLAALPLAFVGFIDDRHSLPASWRYGVQLATALVLILLSPLPLPWLAMPLLLLAATAVINFTNFMDGLDGLVAGCMAITFAAACLQRLTLWPLWALVGSLLGFLLWNWSPAKVFMGDVGSTFLGAVFVGLVLQAPSWTEALALLLVATPLLGDACLCVPRRLLAGQRVFQAHRLHLFQRLHQAGWPHARVAILYIAATACLALAFNLGGLNWVVGLAVVELFVGFWLERHVAVPFAVASQS